MRYILVKNLKPGMVVARPFYNKNLSALLNEGIALKASHINSIKRIGVRGIYIHDEISKDVEFTPIIDDKTKLIFAGAVNEMFEGVGKALPHKNSGLKDIIRKLINQVSDNQDAVVNMLDLKQFDDYTFQHCINVCILSIIIGVHRGFSEKTLENLAMAAAYHDIGKLRVPLSIVNKPGELDDYELEEMRQHAALGVEYLKTTEELNSHIEMGILQHHERYNGTGYPLALKGEEISEIARIISIADVFDAITSKRSYKEASLPSEAVEYIMGNAGRHFDYDIVKVFLNRVAAYPVGLTVELNNGLRGIVVETFEDFTMRPKVKVLPKDPSDEEYYIDLRSPYALTLTVTRVIE